jgi:excinuclease ABC subunit A
MKDGLTHIRIRGAREHNLKSVNADIPRNELVVITGLSGSGKSSLAFDTIYAEGQRRYVESLSAYARQFLELMQKPDVDSIEGLSPAISIEQKTTSRNPRSTVGTVTEIYDYMRLLWARVGIPYSPATGEPIAAMQVSEMVDRIMALPQGTRLYLLAPIVRDRKGEYKKEMAELLKKGYQRAKIDGEFVELAEPPTLDKKFKHDIDVVIDRIAVKPGIETRLADSLEQALKLAEGVALAEFADKGETGGGKATLKNKSGAPERLIFSQKFACPVSGFTIPEIEPRLFSFNNPAGACPACDGLGLQLKFDAERVVPDHDKTLKEGAVAPWAKGPSPLYAQTLEALAKRDLRRRLHRTGHDRHRVGHRKVLRPDDGVAAAQPVDVDAVRDLEDMRHVVGDQDDRHAARLDVLDELQNPAALLDAQRRRRFVHNDELGGEGGGAGDRDALALAAREGLHRLGDGLHRHQAELGQLLPREVAHLLLVQHPE